MAYIQSTINARSCCVMFLSFFFSSSSCSQSFICSTFFLCREIPENVLVDNYWRFHTMNYNSRKSNFYDSHAQREMTLACSEDTEQWWLYCRDERGGGDWHTDTSSECVVANFWGESTVHCEGRWRTAELSAGALSRNLTPYLLITLVSLVKLLFN